MLLFILDAIGTGRLKTISNYSRFEYHFLSLSINLSLNVSTRTIRKLFLNIVPTYSEPSELLILSSNIKKVNRFKLSDPTNG